jgi:hypothetical protein
MNSPLGRNNQISVSRIVHNRPKSITQQTYQKAKRIGLLMVSSDKKKESSCSLEITSVKRPD